MKNKVINWLRSGCAFKEGLMLLPMDGILFNLHRTCSLQGETKSNKEMLLYQLCKHVGISEKQALEFMKQKKIVKQNVTIPQPPLPPKDRTPDNPVPPQAQKQQEHKKEEVTEPVVKIREEFPFLNNKDCPDELKILVANRITAWKNYCDAHAQIMGCNNDEDMFLTSRDVVENYLENHLIYEELNHYKKTGKLLMKHPIFENRKRDAEIKKMKVSELIKLKKNIEMNIWRNEKKIKTDPKSEFTFSRQQTVEKYKRELKLVNLLTGVVE